MAAAGAAFDYDYVSLTLEPGAGGAVQRRLAEHLAAAAPAARAGGLQLVGLFAPQLGWRAHQAAALVRRDGAGDGGLETLFDTGPIAAWMRERLRPTLRPQDKTPPAPGGVYVHRWFTVKAADLAEFLDLSSQGWVDFEERFDARIFGLFEAERVDADVLAGVVRVLLLTRYGDHGVWEASRDPTTAAMQTFIRRQSLTVETFACSTLLVPLDDG